jgi:predicted ATPase
LVFTDIEGSTRLLEELGEEAYREALGEHRRVVREAFGRLEGYEVDYEGDAFFYAFVSAQGAVDAVGKALRGLEGGPIRIRVGIHTGEPGLDPPKYVGPDVHLAARVMSAGHGGQVLLSKATRELVDVDLYELGEHRLKDFAEPVSIYQLGDASFPPLKTISNTNLPRPASSFVGREREVGEIVALVRSGARLVTLTGPGGSGKTRLAIEAAAELLPEFKAGVFWVGLAALREPTLVLETVAQTLGAKDELRSHIAERELVLLLDNLEQVVEAGPELADLVESCPNLVLLVTSRELLRVRGEVEYEVLPLAEPEAVTLLCQRAQLPPSEPIAELCRRLDNIPLALELAAARAKALPPEQILERLSQRLDLFKGGRDADPRQQTLRAAIEWSYDLLTPEEQRLFSRLSVFASGCTLEAAEQVCDAALDTLQSLVEKSLLRHTNGRFWMLETIREYALERLDVRTDAELRRRVHADYFLAIAEDSTADEVSRLARLELEHENLRAALRWTLAEGSSHVLLGLRLTAALGRFWYVRAYALEGSTWLERALSATPKAEPAMRAKAIYSLGVLADERGDLGEAARLLEESSELWRASEDRGGFATSLNSLAVVARNRGDRARARALFEQSLELKRELGDLAAISTTTCGLGTLAVDEGKFAEARLLLEESLAIDRHLGDRLGVAINLGNLAAVALETRDLGRARQLAAEALETFGSLGDQDGVAEGLEQLASIAAGEDAPRHAARLAGAARALRAAIGMPLSLPDQARLDGHLAAAREKLGPAGFEAAFAEGGDLTPEAGVAEALASGS